MAVRQVKDSDNFTMKMRKDNEEIIQKLIRLEGNIDLIIKKDINKSKFPIIDIRIKN